MVGKFRKKEKKNKVEYYLNYTTGGGAGAEAPVALWIEKVRFCFDLSREHFC